MKKMIVSDSCQLAFSIYGAAINACILAKSGSLFENIEMHGKDYGQDLCCKG